MAWNNAVVTNKGVELLREAAGNGVLTFVSASGSDSTYPNASLMAQTAPSNEKQTFSITKISNVSSGKKLCVQITNKELTHSYFLKQLCIWAKVNNGTPEVLAIIQDDTGVLIPAEDEISDYLLKFYALLKICNDAEMNVTVDGSSFATVEALEEHKKDTASHLTDKAQTFSGVKTFIVPPVVPEPKEPGNPVRQADLQAHKEDTAKHLTDGAQTINGVKTFEEPPEVPEPTKPQNPIRQQEFETHTKDKTSHVTAEEKETWNGKIGESDKSSIQIAKLGYDNTKWMTPQTTKEAIFELAPKASSSVTELQKFTSNGTYHSASNQYVIYVLLVGRGGNGGEGGRGNSCNGSGGNGGNGGEVKFIGPLFIKPNTDYPIAVSTAYCEAFNTRALKGKDGNPGTRISDSAPSPQTGNTVLGGRGGRWNCLGCSGRNAKINSPIDPYDTYGASGAGGNGADYKNNSHYSSGGTTTIPGFNGGRGGRSERAMGYAESGKDATGYGNGGGGGGASDNYSRPGGSGGSGSSGVVIIYG